MPLIDVDLQAELPVHRRQVEIEVYEREDHFVVIGRLRDDRPWAAGTAIVEHVHAMELRIAVRRADLTILEAGAHMDRFPHAECPSIEAAFTGLVGMSIARGYTRAVQERFGRSAGCTHLEFLARALGPAVVQAIPSAAIRRRSDDDPGAFSGGIDWLVGTCHVWAADGPGLDKIALGWKPGDGEYPAPSAVTLRARAAGTEA